MQRSASHAILGAGHADAAAEHPHRVAAGVVVRHPPLLLRGRHGRNAPVRRIHDERRLAGVRHGRAEVEPEVVVVGRRQAVPVDFVVEQFGGLLLQYRDLLIRQHRPIAEIDRPLQRYRGAEVVDALQVRRAPRGARDAVGRRRGLRGRNRGEGEKHGREDDVPDRHGGPLPKTPRLSIVERNPVYIRRPRRESGARQRRRLVRRAPGAGARFPPRPRASVRNAC